LTKAIDTERRLVAFFAADVAGYWRLMGADELGTLRDFNAAAEHPRWCKSRTSRPDRQLSAPDAHAVLEAKEIERNVHGMSQMQGRRSGRQQVLQRLRRSRPVPMRRVWCPEPSRIEVLL
jgi:hypothetical protein